jgi:hypothetical protein
VGDLLDRRGQRLRVRGRGDPAKRDEPRGGDRGQSRRQQDTQRPAGPARVSTSAGPAHARGAEPSGQPGPAWLLLARRAERREGSVTAGLLVRATARGKRPDQVIEAGVE